MGNEQTNVKQRVATAVSIKNIQLPQDWLS